MTLLRRLASALWSFGSALARGLASRGILLKPVRLGVRVISVGNLQAGGAGKTPLVAHIAGEALARGLKVCILCRGYGGDLGKARRRSASGRRAAGCPGLRRRGRAPA